VVFHGQNKGPEHLTDAKLDLIRGDKPGGREIRSFAYERVKLRTAEGFMKALKKMGWGILALAGLMLGPLAPAAACLCPHRPSKRRPQSGRRGQGLAAVHDLTASTGTTGGTINLTWTEPYRNGTMAPYSYVVRVSTFGEISNNNDFAAAEPLSIFSNVSLPTPGPGGSQNRTGGHGPGSRRQLLFLDPRNGFERPSHDGNMAAKCRKPFGTSITARRRRLPWPPPSGFGANRGAQ